MARTVGIGIQSFEKIRNGNYFYIDKTGFIKEWWESGDDVTLITRPRRFGKTLNISMLEQFFSLKYRNRPELFEDLAIWKEEKYRKLQGTYPVISLSFATIKEKDYPTTRKKICQLISKLYAENSFLLDSGLLHETDVAYFKRVSERMDDSDASLALYQLSDFLYRYYGRKVIILLDEYDTPMQEAYVDSYWDEPERFYHGFVLGLLVELYDRYVITSNRESGFGRYDVMLEPRNAEDVAIILEFKVHDEEDESDMNATVEAALKQIEERQYAANLVAKGIPKERIRCYGIAFQGKNVLIG